MKIDIHKEFVGFNVDLKSDKILVAVSGGLDSMVLVDTLFQGGFTIGIAHCNYQLRGKDSDLDEQFVIQWCEERNVPFYSKRINTYQRVQESGNSVQMVARDARYAFFETLMAEHNYKRTALAHHGNDRVETLILNVLRGTGIRGLQGMPRTRDGYIRPLLDFEKSDLRKYANNQNVSYREDASNLSLAYQRNWVRLRVIPMLLTKDKNAINKLLDFCNRVEKALPEIKQFLNKDLDKVYSNNGLAIGQLSSHKYPFTLLTELLREKNFNSAEVFEVLKLLEAQSGSFVESSTHKVFRDRQTLLISAVQTCDELPKLKVEVLPINEVSSLQTPRNEAFFDADKLESSTLTVRKWKKGDRFKPLGMNGWQLLSDFFINQKFSIPEKKKVWLLTSQEMIVWIIGYRIDNRFKVTPTTQKVLKVSVS